MNSTPVIRIAQIIVKNDRNIANNTDNTIIGITEYNYWNLDIHHFSHSTNTAFA
ncbi:MAG: hypothetical protein WA667_23100 [Candidatus Nitrosopolaris sp.]